MPNLDEFLRAAAVPDSATAKERTKMLAHARLERRDRPESSANPGSSAPRFRVLAIAGACAVGVAVIAATPPGQSAAAWVGELVGIGDGAPQPQVVRSQSVTLGAGAGPRNEPYAVVADRPEAGGEVCLSLDWPEAKKATTTCGYPPDAGGLGRPSPADQTALGTPFLIEAKAVGLDRRLGPDVGVVHGNAAADVSEVQVTYRDSAGEAHASPTRLFALEGEAEEQIGAEGPLKAYVAFVPADGLDSVEVTAYDQDGEVTGAIAGGDRLGSTRPKEVDKEGAPKPSVKRAP